MTYLVRVSLDIEEAHPEKSLRFQKSAATIKSFNRNGAKVVILSHLGRPKGYDKKLSLTKFKRPLEQYLKKKIVFINGKNLKKDSELIRVSRPGTIFLLENLRFNKGEVSNSPVFAKSLSSLGDKYINDDFATVHHKNTSNVGILKFVKGSASPNVISEVKNLTAALKRPKKPFVFVIGGAKMSDKIEVIKNLLGQVDFILLGGGPANTFMKAKGLNIGKSLYEPEMLKEAKGLSKNKKIILPSDSVWSQGRILDIGPKTIRHYESLIGKSKTIIWGGPVGFFEKPKFAGGTKSIWQAILRNKKAKVVVGGGETLASLRLVTTNYKLKTTNLFLSTGGGAMLEFLSGKKLPGLVALRIQK